MSTDLIDAIDQHDAGKVSALLSAGADPNLARSLPPHWRPLGYAIEELEFGGSLDIVRLLIANGADVNAVYVDTGLTGLHAAVFSENIEVIKLVLDAGADPNIPDNEDTSPLKFSVEQGSFEMAKLLLEYGAERTINEAGGFCGCTALALAASKLDIAMIELLLKNGADPDTRDADGQTARQYLPPPDESDNEAWDAARDLLQGG